MHNVCLRWRLDCDPAEADGSVNFDRSWKEYKEGFGDLHTEYWLGNEHIHDLSSQGDYKLRIDLEDWSGKHKTRVYQSFRWGTSITDWLEGLQTDAPCFNSD